MHFATSEKFSSSNLSGNIFLTPFEDQEIYKKFIKDIVCFAPDYGKKLIKLMLNKNLVCGNIFLQLEDKKEFNNKISLSDIKDSLGIPRCIVNYRFKNEVIKSAKIITESFAQSCIDNDLGRIAIKNEIINLSKLENLGVNHHIGGTIMGSDYKNSVVDKNLKIHGMKNLYIAGSSVFPSTGYANPTFTIVQLSLRLADEIYKNIYNT
jgi:choline dehydrogenase-like flavoprotein